MYLLTNGWSLNQTSLAMIPEQCAMSWKNSVLQTTCECKFRLNISGQEPWPNDNKLSELQRCASWAIPHVCCRCLQGQSVIRCVTDHLRVFQLMLSNPSTYLPVPGIFCIAGFALQLSGQRHSEKYHGVRQRPTSSISAMRGRLSPMIQPH